MTEAVGHFHLFSWLQTAVGKQCAVSPEFPTGNGLVDLHLRYNILVAKVLNCDYCERLLIAYVNIRVKKIRFFP